MRLLDLWSGGLTPREVLNYIDHLPRTSATAVAIADDEELAAALPDPKPGPPPLGEWSAEVEKLTLIADRMGELIVAVHNTVAKKPAPKPRPLQRPVTARQRLERQRRQWKHDHVTAQLAAAAECGRPSMADVVASDTDTAIKPRR